MSVVSSAVPWPPCCSGFPLERRLLHIVGKDSSGERRSFFAACPRRYHSRPSVDAEWSGENSPSERSGHEEPKPKFDSIPLKILAEGENNWLRKSFCEYGYRTFQFIWNNLLKVAVTATCRPFLGEHHLFLGRGGSRLDEVFKEFVRAMLSSLKVAETRAASNIAHILLYSVLKCSKVKVTSAQHCRDGRVEEDNKQSIYEAVRATIDKLDDLI